MLVSKDAKPARVLQELEKTQYLSLEDIKEIKIVTTLWLSACLTSGCMVPVQEFVVIFSQEQPAPVICSPQDIPKINGKKLKFLVRGTSYQDVSHNAEQLIRLFREPNNSFNLKLVKMEVSPKKEVGVAIFANCTSTAQELQIGHIGWVPRKLVGEILKTEESGVFKNIKAIITEATRKRVSDTFTKLNIFVTLNIESHLQPIMDKN